VAALTMVVGVLGAIAQEDVKRILSFNIVGQIGYMLVGVGLFDVAGLAAVIVSLVHHIVVKTSLFLTEGLIEHHAGTSRLDHLGGLVRRAPAVAWCFGVAALALVGIPPLSGFVSKFALFGAIAHRQEWWILGVAVAVSLLTLFSMTKIWIGAFWAPADPAVAGAADRSAPAAAPRPTPVLMLAPTVVLVAATVALGVLGGPLVDLATRAAGDLVHPSGYLRAVGGR